MKIESFIKNRVLEMKVIGIMTVALIVLGIELLKDPKALNEILSSREIQ